MPAFTPVPGSPGVGSADLSAAGLSAAGGVLTVDLAAATDVTVDGLLLVADVQEAGSVASLRFPDNGSRYVFLPNGRPAANARIYYYADAALTVPAEIYADVDGSKGALVAADVDGRVSLRLDAFGGQRSFWGPASGQDRLWTVANGVVSAIDADYNARIDSVEARLAALEAGGGGGPGGSGGITVDPDNSNILIIDDSQSDGLTFDGDTLVVTL